MKPGGYMNVSQKHNQPEAFDCEKSREMICARFLESLQPEAEIQLKRHMAHCESCRDTEAELNTLVTGLKGLKVSSLEPSPDFKRTWRAAIVAANKPPSEPVSSRIMEIVRELLGRNWRPALGLSTVWLLIFVFSVGTPKPVPVETGTTDWSPGEAVQFFNSERQFLIVGNIQPDQT